MEIVAPQKEKSDKLNRIIEYESHKKKFYI